MYSTTYDGEFVLEVPSSEADLEKTFRAVKAGYHDKDTRIKYLEQKVKELEDEKWKDVELQELKKKNEDYYRGFPISPDENEKLVHWQNEHTKNIHNAVTLEQVLRLEGVSGGRWVYEFTPTAIGTFGSCFCGSCRSRAIAESKGDMKAYHDLLKKYDAQFDFQENV
jgi:hypothetical protein